AGTALLADAEGADELPVPIEVAALQVVEQPTALPDELQQTATRVVVLHVGLEVLGEVVDPLGEEGDLHLRRAGVALVEGKLAVGSLFGRGGEAFCGFLWVACVFRCFWRREGWRRRGGG